MDCSKSVLVFLPTRLKFDKLNLNYFVMTIFIHVHGTVDVGEGHILVCERGLTFLFLCLEVCLMFGASPHRCNHDIKAEMQLVLDLGLVCCVS